MKVHGHCHCRAIAYEAEIDPARVTICHCTDCQQLTGTAYRVSVPARREDFVLRSGTPTTYLKTTADSGAPRVQAFCPTCGSSIYTRAAREDFETYGLRVGCLVERRFSRRRARSGALGVAMGDGHRRVARDGD